jgi:hypothetical protein
MTLKLPLHEALVVSATISAFATLGIMTLIGYVVINVTGSVHNDDCELGFYLNKAGECMRSNFCRSLDNGFYTGETIRNLSYIIQLYAMP